MLEIRHSASKKSIKKMANLDMNNLKHAVADVYVFSVSRKDVFVWLFFMFKSNGFYKIILTQS